MKKIISVDLGVIRSHDEFESTLTYKMFSELSKYFDVEYHIYVDANVNIDDFTKDVNYKIHSISYYSIKKILRPFIWMYLYWNNIKTVRKNHADLVFIGVTSSFADCFIFLYRLFSPKQKYYVQLYTPSVNKKKWKRDLLDKLVSWNLRLFKYIGAGKDGNQNCIRYNIPASKNLQVEIGKPDYGYKKRLFENLNFIYIGTLNGRDIWKTIGPIDKFISSHPEVEINYHIVGGGNFEEVEILNSNILSSKNRSNIIYHGRLSNNDMKKILKECNIGIAYLPINEYYNNVPTTKLYEYALSGMPVIATKTNITVQSFNERIGVLCNDNAEDFYRALNVLFSNIQANRYSSEEIRSLYEEYSITTTMKNNYIPIISNII